MQKELLSAYMDDEQVNAEFTKILCESKDLRQSWVSFHLVRSIVRKESSVLLGSDFTKEMERLIELEDIDRVEKFVPQPTPEETASFVQRLKTYWSPILQVAVAAGVCGIAVLGVQSFNAKENNVSDVPVLQTLPFNNSVQEASYNIPAKEPATLGDIEQKNRRIGDMLQTYELQRRIHADIFNIEKNPKK